MAQVPDVIGLAVQLSFVNNTLLRPNVALFSTSTTISPACTTLQTVVEHSFRDRLIIEIRGQLAAWARRIRSEGSSHYRYFLTYLGPVDWALLCKGALVRCVTLCFWWRSDYAKFFGVTLLMVVAYCITL